MVRFNLTRTKGKPFHDGHHRVSSSDPLPLSETFSGLESSRLRCPLLLHRVAEGGEDSDIASPPKIQTEPTTEDRHTCALPASPFRCWPASLSEVHQDHRRRESEQQRQNPRRRCRPGSSFGRKGIALRFRGFPACTLRS